MNKKWQKILVFNARCRWIHQLDSVRSLVKLFASGRNNICEEIRVRNKKMFRHKGLGNLEPQVRCVGIKGREIYNLRYDVGSFLLKRWRGLL